MKLSLIHSSLRRYASRGERPFPSQADAADRSAGGASARVFALQGEASVCSRLREIGFCESATVAVVSGRKTLLCDLCGTRIALSEGAANHIVVELIRGGP